MKTALHFFQTAQHVDETRSTCVSCCAMNFFSPQPNRCRCAVAGRLLVYAQDSAIVIPSARSAFRVDLPYWSCITAPNLLVRSTAVARNMGVKLLLALSDAQRINLAADGHALRRPRISGSMSWEPLRSQLHR